MTDERIKLDPAEVLIRVFRRSKTDISQEKRIGDFDRANTDKIGISAWRISKRNLPEIFGEFYPQRIGTFQATVKELQDKKYKPECLQSDPAHVDLCCPDCNCDRVSPCAPESGGACPLIEQPGHGIEELMDLFHLHTKAEWRDTGKLKPRRTR